MKTKFQKRLSNEQGFLAILAIILIVVIGFLGLAMTSMFYDTSSSAASHYQSDSALYLAESGLEHATHELLQYTVTDRSACAGLTLAPLAFGKGAYNYASTAAPTYVSTPTTLSSALTATATSISVASTTGYTSSGRIMIDGEFINYASISATTFNNVSRGLDNTVASSHANGTLVGQYVCNITAQGGVPNLTSPLGKRSLAANVSLEDAFAVGDGSGNNITAARWNQPVESTWNNISQGVGTPINLLGAQLISYVDGWFVGSSGILLHWNGSLGTSVIATSPNGLTVNYNSVFCNAGNDCHAVGNFDTGNNNLAVIINLTSGTTWTQTTFANTAINKSTNLLGVHCSSTTDCWAVGNSKNFFHWNGTTWTAIAQTLTTATYTSVFCNAANNCWAVGNGSTFAKLTSGTAWANVTTTLPAVQYNSITCNNASDCWAVGNVSSGNDVFAHFDGTTWTKNTSTPTPIANLTSVQCLQKNNCWAVGYSNTGSNAAFVHYDGTAWTQFTGMSGGALPAGKPLRSITIVGSSGMPISNWSETFS